MDPDPDPAIFVKNVSLQDQQKTNFLCIFLFEGTLTSYFNDKKSKNVAKQ